MLLIRKTRKCWIFPNLCVDPQEAARAVVCAGVSGANESGLTFCPCVWISGQTLEVILNFYPHILNTHDYSQIGVSAMSSSFACKKKTKSVY